MKKTLILSTLMGCAVMFAVGCGNNLRNANVEKDTLEAGDTNESNANEDILERENENEDNADTYIFEGSCDYTIKLPVEYKSLVKIQSWEDGDCFIHIASEKGGTGGILFTIQSVLNKDLQEILGMYDDAEVLYENETNTIFIGKATDVEFNENTAEEYQELLKRFDEIKDSFTYNGNTENK